MSAFHDTSILKEAWDRLAEGLTLDDLQNRIRTLENQLSEYQGDDARHCTEYNNLAAQNAALREVALEVAEYLEKWPISMMSWQHIDKLAAKLRAALEKVEPPKQEK